MAEPKKAPLTDYRRTGVVGLLSVVVLAGGGLAWASIAEVAGAVVAGGTVVVEGKPKSVQHLDGGVVRTIHIAPGDRVASGQVLIKLDETNIAANLAIYRSRLRDALIRKARLAAELGGKD